MYVSILKTVDSIAYGPTIVCGNHNPDRLQLSPGILGCVTVGALRHLGAGAFDSSDPCSGWAWPKRDLPSLLRTCSAAAAKSLQSCPVGLIVRPHRRQPTRLRRPWDSPGKNTGVGCHFLLQCMKVKSESEVAQSLATPWTAAYQTPPSMGFARQEYWSGLVPQKFSFFPENVNCSEMI